MLQATATVAGGEAGKEASLNRVDLIQKVLKIVKTGVSLLEALCTGATFSVTLNGPAFAFCYLCVTHKVKQELLLLSKFSINHYLTL